MYTIGVDLGGTNIAIGLCDESLNIIDKGSVPTNAQRSGEEIIRDMASLAEELIKRNGLSLADIASVGIATPGIANSETGIVEYANNLPFRDFPIANIFPLRRCLSPTTQTRQPSERRSQARQRARRTRL